MQLEKKIEDVLVEILEGKSVDSRFIRQCHTDLDSFGKLPKEQVFEFFRKLLMMAEKPSIGLEFMQKCGWISHFPELKALIGCKQKKEWHPEGDVWTHTLRAIDEAAMIRDQVDSDWRLAFLFGVLLHDTGKPLVTDPESLTAYGHAEAGIGEARRFMERICDQDELVERVISIVGNHMQARNLLTGNAKIGGWRRFHKRIRLDIMGWHAYVDKRARSLEPESADCRSAKACFNYFEKIENEPVAPVLTGKHLIEAGFQPGKDFKKILEKAYDHQRETGETDPERLLELVKERNK